MGRGGQSGTQSKVVAEGGVGGGRIGRGRAKEKGRLQVSSGIITSWDLEAETWVCLLKLTHCSF